jgi:hypothetical protein
MPEGDAGTWRRAIVELLEKSQEIASGKRDAVPDAVQHNIAGR